MQSNRIFLLTRNKHIIFLFMKNISKNKTLFQNNLCIILHNQSVTLSVILHTQILDNK